MPDFLHGIETAISEQGPVPVRVIKTSVIGLIGIAPKGPLNTPTLVQSAKDAAAFGKMLPGFTIPHALNDILAQGAATVIVVNVFDPATHVSTVSAEAHTLVAGKTKTTYAPVEITSVTNSGGSTTYVAGTDYTFDEYGNMEIVSGGAITATQAIKINYKKLNAAAITNSVIQGEYDDTNDTYTGLEAFDLAKNLFGFGPRILIAPEYCTVDAIVTSLLTKAEKYNAIALIDAPANTTIANAIAGRSIGGSINFEFNDVRGVPCFPRLKAYDPYSDADVTRPYSQFLAGVMAATDLNEGYHVSPSNHVIKGTTGVEVQITWDLNDANCNANLLNAAGIVTVASGFGTGLRVWGNRNSKFPSSSSPTTFISVQRVADVLNDSVEQAMLDNLDKPIGPGLIDHIMDTINAFMRSLVQRGAIVDGKCTFDPAKNPAQDIADGKLVFDNTFMPPTPAERLTFNSIIDTSLLKAVTVIQ